MESVEAPNDIKFEASSKDPKLSRKSKPHSPRRAKVGIKAVSAIMSVASLLGPELDAAPKSTERTAIVKPIVEPVLENKASVGYQISSPNQKLADSLDVNLGIELNLGFERELPALPEFKSPHPDQRVIVIPLKEKGGKEPLSEDQFKESLDKVASLYEEQSFGNLHLQFEVLPWQQVDLPTERDDPDKIKKIGDKILQQSGKDLDSYQTRMYVLAFDNQPAYGGIAFASNEDRPFAPNVLDRIVLPIRDDQKSFETSTGHEMGHVFGLGHANDVHLSGVAGYSGKTVFDEYIKNGDPMGVPTGETPRELNALDRISLGWIPEDQVETVEDNGIFTINHVASGDGTLALRINKPNADTNLPWDRYYVSLRIKNDFSPQLDFHLWKEELGCPTNEVIADPPIYSIGDEWQDSVNGIRIKLLSLLHYGQQAKVQVTFDDDNTRVFG